ncbi:hypothetical protein ACXYMU_00715 [Pontibacter sp. CAU 1760]
MKAKFLSIAIALIALFSFQSAFAQHPNLKSPLTSSVTSTQQLKVDYDISGLGNVSTVKITVSFDLNVDTYCFNKGRRSTPVPGLTQHFENQSSTFDVPVRNGRASGSITTNETIKAGDCPAGMDRTETTVAYTNITLEVLGSEFPVGDAIQ